MRIETKQIAGLVPFALIMLALTVTCLGPGTSVLCLSSESHVSLEEWHHRCCSSLRLSPAPESRTTLGSADFGSGSCHCDSCVDLVVDQEALVGEGVRVVAPISVLDTLAEVANDFFADSVCDQIRFKTEGLSPHLAGLASVLLLI